MIALDALQQTLSFLPLVLGIYLSYRILNITDLTVGASFVLGAATYAKLTSLGLPPYATISLAALSGAASGLFVFLLQKFAKINSLITGILAVFMLFSVNFGVIGQPNMSLLSYPSFLGNLQQYNTAELLFTLGVLALLMLSSMAVLLRSTFGLKLRAYGNNPALLNRLGDHADNFLAVGLILSNTLAAFSGVMAAQLNGYADIHMGDGMALTAIGAVVIGIQLVRSLFLKTPRFLPTLELVSCLIGALIYFSVLHLFLSLNVNPIYLKFFLGLLLASCLSTAYYSKQRKHEHETFVTN